MKLYIYYGTIEITTTKKKKIRKNGQTGYKTVKEFKKVKAPFVVNQEKKVLITCLTRHYSEPVNIHSYKIQDNPIYLGRSVTNQKYEKDSFIANNN